MQYVVKNESLYLLNFKPSQTTSLIAPIPFYHQKKYWILKSFSNNSGNIVSNNTKKISGVALSTFGQELYHILDIEPIPEYTKVLKDYFHKQNLEMILCPEQS